MIIKKVVPFIRIFEDLTENNSENFTIEHIFSECENFISLFNPTMFCGILLRKR